MLLSITVVAVVVQVVFRHQRERHQTLFQPLCQEVQEAVDDTTKDLETLVVREVGLQVVDLVVDTQTVL
jgi:hypothetical protein